MTDSIQMQSEPRYLTKEELFDACELQSRSKQRAWLEEQGIPYKLSALGEVLVEREVYIAPMRNGGMGNIYLIRSEGTPPYLKIGIADSPEARLKALQTASPVPLTSLATWHTLRAMERILHKEFAHLRVQGEWFKNSASIYRRFRIKKSAK